MLMLTHRPQCLKFTSQRRASLIVEHGVMAGFGLSISQQQAPCAGSERQPAVHGIQEGLGAL